MLIRWSRMSGRARMPGRCAFLRITARTARAAGSIDRLRITAGRTTVTSVITGGRRTCLAPGGAGAALLLVGLTMRPTIVALPPLLADVQAAAVHRATA